MTTEINIDIIIIIITDKRIKSKTTNNNNTYLPVQGGIKAAQKRGMMNNNAFRNLSYGVYIVSTWDEGRATGCTANSAIQITAEPATIAVSINHQNYTNQCIEKTGKFAISVLGEHSEPSLIGGFGFRSGRDVNKFDGIAHEVKGYMPVVSDACAYFTCDVIDKMETETHTVFLGKVTDCDVLKQDTPMTYAYYHNVIKGKSPKAAPTYLPED